MPEFKTEISAKHDGMAADLVATVEVMTARVRSLEEELAVHRSASHRPVPAVEIAHSTIQVPDPKPFDGTRSAKDLENFLWDMEQYFAAAHVNEGEKVTITSMYLTGDAKLWWRTQQQGDDHAQRPRIASWEGLKKKLRDQFLPCNTGWLAREALKGLKHTGTVRDYVKEFSSLMLDITNMSEEDKLFNFTSGLQPWAQAELRRQAVKDLPSAIAAAEGLVDFINVAAASKGKKGAGESQKSGGTKEGKHWDGNGGKKWKEGDTSKGKDAESSQNRGKFTKGCFICNGPHRARECPKRGAVAAIVSEPDEEGDAGNPPGRCAPMMLLNPLAT